MDSHLEFDVTVVNVANSPVDEFKMKLEQFCVERTLGAAVCLGCLVLTRRVEFWDEGSVRGCNLRT